MCVRGILTAIGCAAVLGVAGCLLPPTEVPTPGATVSFSQQIQPILTANCAICHQRGGFANVVGYELLLDAENAYADLMSQRSIRDGNLAFVAPGDPDASYFFEKIASDAPQIGGRMPVGRVLADADIELVRRWIAEGALDN